MLTDHRVQPAQGLGRLGVGRQRRPLVLPEIEVPAGKVFVFVRVSHAGIMKVRRAEGQPVDPRDTLAQ